MTSITIGVREKNGKKIFLSYSSKRATLRRFELIYCFFDEGNFMKRKSKQQNRKMNKRRRGRGGKGEYKFDKMHEIESSLLKKPLPLTP